MRSSFVFLCLGQGSQYFNMTYRLYEQNAVYKKYMDDLNDYCYEITGYSVLDYMYDKSKSYVVQFNDLKLSSLALFMCQYSLGKLLIDQGIHPECIVGLSMGEFVALALSNSSNWKMVIQVLFKMTSVIGEKCQKGGMLTILDCSKIYFEERDIFEQCEIAGINYDKNFVISGSNQALEIVINYLEKKRIVFQRLPVQYAFHSKMIEEIRREAENEFYPLKLKVPIGSCAYGGIIKETPQTYVWDILRRPMLFQETIKSVEKDMNPIYIDLGPNGTLSNFIKRGANQQHKSYAVISMFNRENENLKEIMDQFSGVKCY